MLVPNYPGITAALGLLTTDMVYEYTKTSYVMASELARDKKAAAALEKQFEALEADAIKQFAKDKIDKKRVKIEWIVDARYEGQDYELRVDAKQGKVSEADVKAYFKTMGSPGASTWSPSAPHPYMQKVRALDICVVLEGEITLVLDTQEVALKAGDIVVQRGTNHAWSNRSDKPAIVSVASHDGKYSA